MSRDHEAARKMAQLLEGTDLEVVEGSRGGLAVYRSGDGRKVAGYGFKYGVANGIRNAIRDLRKRGYQVPEVGADGQPES